MLTLMVIALVLFPGKVSWKDSTLTLQPWWLQFFQAEQCNKAKSEPVAETKPQPLDAAFAAADAAKKE